MRRGWQQGMHIRLYSWYYHGELSYPMPVERVLLVRQQLPNPSDGSCLIAELLHNRSEWLTGIGSPTIVAFSIEYEIEAEEWERRHILMYSATGEYLGEDAGPRRFFGRAPETLRFKCGNVVTCLTKGATFELRQGKILGVPLPPERVAKFADDPYTATPDDSDDTYTVYFEDGGDFSHDHLPECYILGQVLSDVG